MVFYSSTLEVAFLHIKIEVPLVDFGDKDQQRTTATLKNLLKTPLQWYVHIYLSEACQVLGYESKPYARQLRFHHAALSSSAN